MCVTALSDTVYPPAVHTTAQLHTFQWNFKNVTTRNLAYFMHFQIQYLQSYLISVPFKLCENHEVFCVCV